MPNIKASMHCQWAVRDFTASIKKAPSSRISTSGLPTKKPVRI
jgi:hypothetical protein